MSKFQWIALAIVLLLATLHFTKILVLPDLLVSVVLGISILAVISFRIYKAKKKENEESSKFS